MSGSILVRGARQILTLRGADGPRRGAAMRDLSIIENASVLIVDGKIERVGMSADTAGTSAHATSRRLQRKAEHHLLRRLRPIDCLHNAAVPHHGNAVTHPQNLR
jgi:hypothetical protein